MVQNDNYHTYTLKSNKDMITGGVKITTVHRTKIINVQEKSSEDKVSLFAAFPASFRLTNELFHNAFYYLKKRI